MKKLIGWYFRVSLILRILVGLAAGATAGVALWVVSQSAGEDTAALLRMVEPFGTVFVHMLKMIVIPVVLFSLVSGASQLAVQQFGRVGIKVLAWYLLCSFAAAVVGVLLAMLINPGSGIDRAQWEAMVPSADVAPDRPAPPIKGTTTLIDMLYRMFANPFEALAAGNFLPIIVFSILFGLALRVSIERAQDPAEVQRLSGLIGMVEACRDVMFRLVGWVLEYSPVGVLALTTVNFGRYGPNIVGPYVSVAAGVLAGIGIMVLGVYPGLLFAATRRNPFAILGRIKEAMIMALVTRSSAATLAVSIRTAEQRLGVRNKLAGFSLPLGATINMDGVCVHLPMFAVLAANMFGVHLTASGLAVLVITTVLASIGAGGVPGGSLMLLFVILETMGLQTEQVAMVVALALGINPVLDMFETMNNVTGDLVCTYVVAENEGLIA
ncbi:MAG TPA: dicarboxylate/amino acid:cation symporter [Phycisphaerales bacterium]|nr:dicarboxylate/amino acid:cation symporter [Phycisphaerales bacterium]